MRFLLFLMLFARAETLTGHAHKGKKELYTEKVELTREKGAVVKSKTQFFSPEGKLLAEMSSVASKNPYVPDIDLSDLRDGYAYTVRTPSPTEIEIRSKESTAENWVTHSRLKCKKDMILIQSVLQFAQEHRAELLEGKRVEASFLVPSKNTDYSMRISLRPGSGNLREIQIESANWVLRNTIFPTILISYDFEAQRIHKFEGISTIMAELGKIEIDY